MTKVLSPALTKAVWAPSIRVRGAPTRKAAWAEIVRGISELEAIDESHPGHELVTMASSRQASWRRPLTELEKAATAFARAPRTHAEGKLAHAVSSRAAGRAPANRRPT